MNASTAPEALSDADYEALEAVLSALHERFEETPQWEFCDGFLAATLCHREPPTEEETLLALLDFGPGGECEFADAAQRDTFLALWRKRVAQVRHALDQNVQSLGDEGAYYPDVLDVRGAVARMDEAERAEVVGDNPIPSYGQVWALGFMFAVEYWPDMAESPRDKEVAQAMDAAMESIVALTEDDPGPYTVSPHDDDDPPSASERRLDGFFDALWAVYDLRRIAVALGPRVQPARRAEQPGRNDPCSCGSGKKYKKCCGA
ncbi:MAG: UPF0149 family protein [Rhodoferax sp.]